MLKAPNLADLDWLQHGFGLRDSTYPTHITTLKQVHSGLVVEPKVESGDRFAEGDALVVRRPGVTVGIRTADCVPVLMADQRTGAVACVHAGWRGTALAIVPAAVREMTARFGTRPRDLRAAVGPCIGPCCYEVGVEVARRFGTWIPELTHTENPQRIDLARINGLQLGEAGVEDVWQAGECTYCAADRFYSFRRDKEEAGRMLSYIGAVTIL